MTEKEKIVYYLESKGISKNRFYKDTGLSQGYLNSGSTLNSDKIKKIINTYKDINLYWLILDQGEMLKKYTPVNQVAESSPEYGIKDKEKEFLIKEVITKDKLIASLEEQIKLYRALNEDLKKTPANVSTDAH